jgi:signal peptidase I
LAAAAQKDGANGAAEGGGKRRKKHKGRELIECLLVAGLLALTIRQFGFQLFKIPTRSMEPTLIGNEDYGDRVVAMMWYKRSGLSLRLGELRRWQVIVFDHKPENMTKSTNYIKRLVGLPGEELHIRDGDIWISASEGKKPHIERKPRVIQNDLWIKLCDLDFSDPRLTPYYWRIGTRAGEADPQKLTRDGRLLLESTAEDPVLLHWRPERAIDNRFIRLTVKHVHCPKEGCKFNDPPEREKGTREPPRFRAIYDTARPVALCPACGTPVWGVRDDGREGVLETALGREVPGGDFWTDAPSGLGSRVSDMRLSMDFADLAGAGRLEVALTCRSERFSFALPLGPAEGAKGELARDRKPVASGQVALAPGARHHLEVINVDGEFHAEIDGLAIGPFDYDPPYDGGRYDSDAEIIVSGGARLEIDNLRLYRDIYYGSAGKEMTPYGRADKASFIAIGSKNYFFMGDNSLASQDGRSFGTKEEKLIVARGLFVAWPPSRFHWLH